MIDVCRFLSMIQQMNSAYIVLFIPTSDKVMVVPISKPSLHLTCTILFPIQSSFYQKVFSSDIVRESDVINLSISVNMIKCLFS